MFAVSFRIHFPEFGSNAMYHAIIFNVLPQSQNRKEQGSAGEAESSRRRSSRSPFVILDDLFSSSVFPLRFCCQNQRYKNLVLEMKKVSKNDILGDQLL